MSGRLLIIIPFFIGFFSIVAGCLLAIYPHYAIELQRRFYLLINWKIEPLSMEKELRNTRIMGFFIIGFALAAMGVAFRIFSR